MHSGTFEVVRMFFQHGGSVEHGQLLHHAVLRDASDCAAMVGYVLDRGALINETMYQNRPENLVRVWYGRPETALQRAAELGKGDVVDLLLERGADPSIRDNLGRLLVETAEEFGQDEVVKRLRQYSRLEDRAAL
ncbi:ankyrin repeat domain-containing protein [bacterium]|nr:ankyrin repeat domain-containing protein [bacterium]